MPPSCKRIVRDVLKAGVIGDNYPSPLATIRIPHTAEANLAGAVAWHPEANPAGAVAPSPLATITIPNATEAILSGAVAWRSGANRSAATVSVA